MVVHFGYFDIHVTSSFLLFMGAEDSGTVGVWHSERACSSAGTGVFVDKASAEGGDLVPGRSLESLDERQRTWVGGN